MNHVEFNFLSLIQKQAEINKIVEDAIMNTNRIMAEWAKYGAPGIKTVGLYNDKAMSVLKSALARPIHTVSNSKSMMKKIKLWVRSSDDGSFIRGIEVEPSRYSPHPEFQQMFMNAFASMKYGLLNTRSSMTNDSYFDTPMLNYMNRKSERIAKKGPEGITVPAINDSKVITIPPGGKIRPNAGQIIDFDLLNKFKFV